MPTQKGSKAVPKPSTSREPLLLAGGGPPSARRQSTWPPLEGSRSGTTGSLRGAGIPGAGHPSTHPAAGIPRHRTPIQVLIEDDASDLSEREEVAPRHIDIPHPTQEAEEFALLPDELPPRPSGPNPDSPEWERDIATLDARLDHSSRPMPDGPLLEADEPPATPHHPAPLQARTPDLPGTPVSIAEAPARLQQETPALPRAWAVVDDLSETEEAPRAPPQRRSTWPLAPGVQAHPAADLAETSSGPADHGPDGAAQPARTRPLEPAVDGFAPRHRRQLAEQGSLLPRHGPLRLDLAMGRQALHEDPAARQRPEVLGTIGFPPARDEAAAQSNRLMSALLLTARQNREEARAGTPEPGAGQATSRPASRVGLTPTVQSVLSTGTTSPVPAHPPTKLGRVYRKKHPQPPGQARAPFRKSVLNDRQHKEVAATYRPLLNELSSGPHALDVRQLANIAGAYGKRPLEVLKDSLPGLCAPPFQFQPRQVADIVGSRQDGHTALAFLAARHAALGQPPFSMSNEAMVEALCQPQGQARLEQMLLGRPLHQGAAAAPFREPVDDRDAD